MTKLRVAVVQMSTGEDVDRNMGQIHALLADIEAVDLIAFPEVFLARGDANTYQRSAQPLDGALVREIIGFARDRNAWILAGSIVELEQNIKYNTCLLLDPSGNIRARYRKIHLFEAHLENGRVIRETDYFNAGSDPVTAQMQEGWHAGISICYDIRFPELYRHYSDMGVNVLFVPSDFTQKTGMDHWEVLLRARAIENQCFVIAPNQCGVNPVTGIASYGNSMAVGPWGEVLCRAGSDETIFIVELDMDLIESTRARIPVLKHRIVRS